MKEIIAWSELHDNHLGKVHPGEERSCRPTKLSRSNHSHKMICSSSGVRKHLLGVWSPFS